MRITVKKVKLSALAVLAAFIFISIHVYAEETQKDLYTQNVEFLLYHGVQFYNKDTETLFKPSVHVTRAEYIKYIVQAVKLQVEKGSSYSDADKHPDKDYINTAYMNGLIPEVYFGKAIQPDKKVTKYDMTMITANALKLDGYETDELYYAGYSDDCVNALSNAYIIFGEYDESGLYNFLPEKTVTYGDAADVLVRAIRYLKSPDEYRAAAIIDYADNVPVDSDRRFYDLLWAMSSERIAEQYVYLNKLDSKKIGGLFDDFTIRNPENSISSLKIQTTGNPKDKVRLRFYYIPLPVTPEEEVEIIHEVSKNIVGKVIKDSMTDTEKFSALAGYLIKNCDYDYDVESESEITPSSTAYNALIEKKAVCQGISAAYNLLAEAAGLKSFAVYGHMPDSDINHMWNAVLVDGKIYFCDITADIGNNGTMKHFMKTAKELKDAGYKFDEKKVVTEYFYR